ncbi:MAG: acetolactate synthase small subunit [Bacteroidales bacterium]|nr:acetolactate synthase small subunit [Bacteroidales bacterium]NLK81972.1 acetolactate synthase small subunit [Bacteroidales bacterium]HPY83182.1 acetolactate synthase small subunit [Bacteroidales bacterium]
MEQKQYTIAVFTENHIGLLNKITIVFTRRKINIESLTVSESQIEGIHSFTIVVNATHEKVQKTVAQINKLVEVIKAFYYEENQIHAQEIALYKMPAAAISQGIDMGRFIRGNNARILEMTPEYFVIEKTGTNIETQELLEKLKPFGILEFIRSGRVIVTKPMKPLIQYMEEKHEAYDYVRK